MNHQGTKVPRFLCVLVSCWFLVAVGHAAGELGPRTDNKPLEIYKEVGIDQKLDQQLPLDLTFRDERGATVTLGQYFGKKPVVLTLVYYGCPMLCTQVLNGLTNTLKTIPFVAGREYDIVTVSFDPTEGPELAAKKKDNYLKQYKHPEAEQGWHFLTGDSANIRKLTSAAGFRYVWDDKLKQFAHAAGIMIVTPQGKLSRYFYGIDYSPKDLRLGLADASEGKIGSLADKILLLCYHYDAVSGRYGFAVMATVRIAGGLTVIIIAAWIWIMVRRESRQRRIALASGGGA